MAEERERRAWRSGAGRIIAAGGAFAGIAGASFWAAPGMASLVLHAAALAGLSAAWLKADVAKRIAEKASADLDFVANRLILLEHRLLQQVNVVDPKLCSTVDEVSGEIGLLGGIVRELAETVAAHDRDVSGLREHLKGQATEPVPAVQPAGLRSGHMPRSDVAPPASGGTPESAQPEPSLFPATRSLRRAGIELIAEKAEREETVPDLIDLGIPLAQSFVFAAPRAVRVQGSETLVQAEGAVAAPESVPASSVPQPMPAPAARPRGRLKSA